MAEKRKATHRNAVRFSRVMRLSWANALGISVGIGLAIYTLLGTFMEMSGGEPLTKHYLMLMLVALPIVLVLAERSGVTQGGINPYRLARSSESILVPFATGWIAIGGYISLVALLGWGAATQLNTLIHSFFGLPIDLTWLAAALIGLLAVNNLIGTNFSWRTVAGLIYFSLLILGGISLRDMLIDSAQASSAIYSFPRAPLNILALMTGILWGLYLVIQVRDQIKRPTRNIFYALLTTLGLVVFFGILGSFTLGVFTVPLGDSLQPIDATGLLNTPEPLSTDTFHILFAISGLIVLLIGIHLCIINALNLIDAMAHDGYLPRLMQTQTPLFQTPLLPISAFTLLAILVAGLIPAYILINLVALTFLWTTASAHINPVLRSDNALPKNRFPKLPFHPLFPALVVATGVFMPFYLDRHVWWYGLPWLLAGAIYYLVYARRRGATAYHHDVTIGEEEIQQAEQEVAYRVMVGIANPDTAIDLINAGVKLARARNGILLVLKILLLADQVPAYLKQEIAREEWQKLADMIEENGVDPAGVKIHPIVRLSYNPATGILETINEEDIDLLLIGWSREAFSHNINAESVINTLIRLAKCDVAVLQGSLPDQIDKIVIPTAGGSHSPVALSISQALADSEDHHTELVHIIPNDTSSSLAWSNAQKILNQTQNAANSENDIKTRVLSARNVPEGILSAAKDSDLLMIGASREDVLDRSYIGDIPAKVSQAAQQATMIVRGRQELEHPWLQRAWDVISSPLPTLSVERRAEVVNSMRAAAVPNIDFFVLILLSSTIASLGLIQNSAAVIIGAMLVAPLMSPILAIAMSMVMGELRVLRTAFEATLKGVLLAIFVGMVMAIFSPRDIATQEILARTSPNVLDLIIALASGAAAGYAISRKGVSAALPGVAIAAALVPPLSVIGYGITTSQLQIASGALLLFITNLIAIVFAASMIFLALGFHPERASVRGLVRGLQITTLSLVTVFLILATTTFITTNQLNRQLQVEAIFEESIAANVAEIQELTVVREGNTYRIKAMILDFEGNEITPEEIEQLETEISLVVDGEVIIDAVIIPATHAETGLELWRQTSLLAQSFEAEMAAANIDIASLSIEETDEGFIIQTTLIVYPESDYGQSELADLNDFLSDLVQAPVSIQASLIKGEFIELESSTP